MDEMISSDKAIQISKLLNCNINDLIFKNKISNNALSVATITFRDNTEARILIDVSKKQYFETKDKEGNIVFVTRN